MDRVKSYIIDYLQREYKLPENVELDSFNFIEKGYVDSMAMVQFIVLLEETFDISFNDNDLKTTEFQTIGGLTSIIRKMEREHNHDD